MTRKTGPVIGYLGVGHLASYTIAALRHGGHDGEIILSPRNAEVAKDLSERFGSKVAASNQAVVDGSDIVVLSVRPQQLAALIDGLGFHPGQIVLSAVAGVTAADLHTFANLPPTVVRFMPSSFIEAGEALWPMWPANDTVEAILRPTGRVVAFETEEQFEKAMLAACAYAWLYDVADAMTGWFAENGWPRDVAREMVIRNLRGATTYALANPDKSLRDILDGTATEGTFTLAGLEQLRSAGAISAWPDALQHLNDKLTGD